MKSTVGLQIRHIEKIIPNKFVMKFGLMNMEIKAVLTGDYENVLFRM